MDFSDRSDYTGFAKKCKKCHTKVDQDKMKQTKEMDMLHGGLAGKLIVGLSVGPNAVVANLIGQKKA